MYDLLLASLFFVVVLSPLAVNASLNWAEAEVFRYEAEEARGIEIRAALTE